MIPKIIHYCWFGEGEMPEKIQKCIDSWKRILPDYEIKLWNEETFDINTVAFTREAHECKKYAFVSDYVRFWALYKYGGIYLDTDVEIIRPMDHLLTQDLFCCLERENMVATCLVAAKPMHELCGHMLAYYDNRHFCVGTKMELKPNTIIFSKIIEQHYGSLNVGQYTQADNICIFPKEYFHPLDSVTNKLQLTENTYAIHWHTALWVEPGFFNFKKFLRTKIIVPLLGERLYKKIYYKIKKINF